MASSARLTTQTLVEKLLPSNYNTPNTVIDPTQWGVILDEASREFESRVGVKYVAFNATTDTPATPKLIQKIVTRLAGVQALEILRPAAYNSDYQDTIDQWEKWTDKTIDGLLTGRVSLGFETVTSETLTFGTGAEYSLSNDRAFLAVQGETDAATDTGEEQPTVHVESVRVTSSGLTGYRLGMHFTVEFNPEFQRWVIYDLKGSLRTHATPTVTYRWSYEQQNQVPTPGRVKSGRLQIV